MYYNSDHSQRRRESAMFGLGKWTGGDLGPPPPLAVIMPGISQKIVYQWQKEQQELQMRLLQAQIAQAQEQTKAQAVATAITQAGGAGGAGGSGGGTAVDIALLQKQYEDALKKQQQDMADYYANLINQYGGGGGTTGGPAYTTTYGGPTSPVPMYQPMPGDFEDAPVRNGRVMEPGPPMPEDLVRRPGTNWWAMFIDSVDAYVDHWEKRK